MSLGTKWLPAWVIGVALFFAAGTIWLRLTIVRTTLDINQVNRMISNSKKDLEQLEVKVARLKSPSRLEALARTKFKLFPPHADQVIRIGTTPGEN